eukprot:6176726-Pleurochrysis_carterae.AAC.5
MNILQPKRRHVHFLDGDEVLNAIAHAKKAFASKCASGYASGRAGVRVSVRLGVRVSVRLGVRVSVRVGVRGPSMLCMPRSASG